MHTEQRAYLINAVTFDTIAAHDLGEHRLVSLDEQAGTFLCMTESLDQLVEVQLRTGRQRNLQHPLTGLERAKVYDLKGNRTETTARAFGKLSGFERLDRMRDGDFWVFYDTIEPGYHLIHEGLLHMITCEEPLCLTIDAQGRTLAFLARPGGGEDSEIHVWKR